MKLFLGNHKNLKIALTGFTGYIGTALSRNIDSGKIIDSLDDVEVDVVLHIGSPLSFMASDIARYVNTNIALAEFVKRTKSKLFYFSTNNVYPLGVCYEDIEPEPSSIYAYTKLIAEEYFKNLIEGDCTILRIGDVFGIGQKHGNFFRFLEKATLEGSDFTLMGSGLKSRSQIWIEDLVTVVLELSCRKELPMILNIATYEPLTNLAIVNSWENYFGRTAIRVEYPQEDTSIRQMLSLHPIALLQKAPLDSLHKYFQSLEEALA